MVIGMMMAAHLLDCSFDCPFDYPVLLCSSPYLGLGLHGRDCERKIETIDPVEVKATHRTNVRRCRW